MEISGQISELKDSIRNLQSTLQILLCLKTGEMPGTRVLGASEIKYLLGWSTRKWQRDWGKIPVIRKNTITGRLECYHHDLVIWLNQNNPPYFNSESFTEKLLSL